MFNESAAKNTPNTPQLMEPFCQIQQKRLEYIFLNDIIRRPQSVIMYIINKTEDDLRPS